MRTTYKTLYSVHLIYVARLYGVLPCSAYPLVRPGDFVSGSLKYVMYHTLECLSGIQGRNAWGKSPCKPAFVLS